MAAMAAAGLLLAVAACGQPKAAPIISSIEGKKSVEARDTAGFKCKAEDPNLEPLSYSWSQEGGSLAWDWGDSVRWFAPESSGKAVIRVTVTNEDGLSASDSLSLTVRAETVTVLFWDAAVKAGEYDSWADTVRAGYTLYGLCGSDSRNISLKAMDDSNFAKWVAGQGAVFLLDKPPYDTHAFSVPIGAFGVYHLVIDNQHGLEDGNFYLRAWKAGP
jgi:hypothetical protein